MIIWYYLTVRQKKINIPKVNMFDDAYRDLLRTQYQDFKMFVSNLQDFDIAI